MADQATTAARTEGRPSIRNNSRHGAIGVSLPNWRMIHASVDANVVANGAAERLNFLLEPK